MKRGGVSRKLIALTAVGAALGVIAGCSSSSQDSDEASGAATGSAPLCKSKGDVSTRYDAILSSGTCADVPAKYGTWKASALFPQAPASIKNRYCKYVWAPASPGKLPEPGALTGLTDAFVTPNCSSTQLLCATGTTCATGSSRVDMSLIPPAAMAVEDPAAAGEGGANGCDVCAVEEENDVYVVLPPEADYTHMDVLYDNGEGVTFGLQRPGDAQSFVVELPEPPAGLEYSGAVRLW